MMDKGDRYQFSGIQHEAQKNLLKKHQANEWTKWNKAGEGYCYMCLKRDWVTATIIDVCYRCADKRGPEPILCLIKRMEYGFCFIHGGYSELEFRHNLAHLNVRLCKTCNGRVAEWTRYLTRTGTHNADPFWKHMRRRFGKDYQELM